MKKIPLILSFSLLSFLVGSCRANAADFNPNQIITDTDLQDWQSMNRPEIHSFLEDKNSYLTNFITEDAFGQRRHTSDIIYQAAKTYQINPKYLLVKLQKEQSLITETSPTERQLNWATGYGACDSCDTTDPRLEKYKGFGKQVDSAAGIMRWYYDNSNSQSWIKRPGVTYTIDNAEVTPVNQATAFLYTYTPHLHGNENFWKLWNTWYKQSYPDGTLIKAQASSTIYIIQDNKKRPIKSMSVLASRFNPKLLITAPAQELDQYETGQALIFSNYSILKSADQYYLLDDDTARPFASREVVRQFGYNPDEIIDATADDIAGYAPGEIITEKSLYPFGRLVKLDGTQNIYYLKDGGYYSIPDPAIATLRFPGVKAKKITVPELANWEDKGALLFPDGTLLGSNLTKQVFVIDKGKKRYFSSAQVFQQLGYKMANVVWVDDLILQQHPTGEPMYAPTAVQQANTPTSTKMVALQMVIKKPIVPVKPKVVVKKAVVKIKAPVKKPVAKKVVIKKLPAAKKKIVVKKIVAPKILVSTVAKVATTSLSYILTTTSSDPYPFTETGKMFATSPEATTFTGDQKIATALDAYLVATVDDANSITQIVSGKNIDSPRPLASFTKVMTGFRLFSDNIDLNSSVTYDPGRHQARYGYLYRVSAGDTIQDRDLFDALLVSSFNTPALMLIDSLGRTEPDFVQEMNQQARDWNLNHTFFYDSYGVDVRNQTTARDYATLFTKALNNQILTGYLDTPQYEYTELADANHSPLHRDINTNRLMQIADKPYTILASKTGYLNEAGFGIAMLVQRDSDQKKFLIITMGNPDYATKYSETNRLTKWAMTNF